MCKTHKKNTETNITSHHCTKTDLKQEKQDKLTSKCGHQAVVSGKEEASIFTTVFINWEGLSEFMAVYL